MSLYSDPEICGDCVHATFFDCGRCLKRCAVGAEGHRVFTTGQCAMRSIPEPSDGGGQS